MDDHYALKYYTITQKVPSPGWGGGEYIRIVLKPDGADEKNHHLYVPASDIVAKLDIGSRVRLEKKKEG